MTPPSAASVISSSEAPTSSPVKLLTALARALALGGATRLGPSGDGGCARVRGGRRSGGSARLGQRALAAGRGDLQRVALAQIAELQRDALAQRERHAIGVVDEHAQAPAAEDLGEQHLDVGLAERETPFDIRLYGCHQLAPLRKKKRACAHFRYCCRLCTPTGQAPIEHSIGARRRAALRCTARRPRRQLGARRGGRDRDRRDSPRARDAASRPAPAAGRPRDGGRAAASSGRGRTARSRWSACSRRQPGTPPPRPRSAVRETGPGQASRGSTPCPARGHALC